MQWITHPADTTLMCALDGELAPARRRSLDRHLSRCAACRSRLGAFERAAADAADRWQVETATAVPVPAGLRRRLQVRLRDVRADPAHSRRLRFARWLGVGSLVARAAITVALLAGLVRLVRLGGEFAIDRSVAPAASLPDTRLTPGAVADVTVAELCSAGRLPRPAVPGTVRQVVLRRYRMEGVPASEYELDYLITPELGGLPDARNLWPERYASGVWNARVKDDLERLLPRLVCDGSVDLARAQHEIAADWIAAYKKYFKTGAPLPREARAGAVRLWAFNRP
ncbi:MAG TPA: zf-HC2 domain-containing protein [Vicinamibacterales bacterium]|jgi:predicted anti-sigma-YlaC factor YlaD